MSRAARIASPDPRALSIRSHPPASLAPTLARALALVQLAPPDSACSSTRVIDEPTQLDWRTLVREVLAFTASLVGILLVLKDSEVHLYEAITLVCCYAVYVLVMAQYSKIVAALCPISTGDGAFEVTPRSKKGHLMVSRQPLVAS